MIYKNKPKQTKEKRETKEKRLSEYYDIRKENQKLKRENSRLRKNLQKNVEPTIEIVTVEESIDIDITCCVECKSTNFKTITLNNKTYKVCVECKHREINANT